MSCEECLWASHTEPLACVTRRYLKFLITFFPKFVTSDLEISGYVTHQSAREYNCRKKKGLNEGEILTKLEMTFLRKEKIFLFQAFEPVLNSLWMRYCWFFCGCWVPFPTPILKCTMLERDKGGGRECSSVTGLQCVRGFMGLNPFSVVNWTISSHFMDKRTEVSKVTCQRPLSHDSHPGS